MTRLLLGGVCALACGVAGFPEAPRADAERLVPRIEGDWWTVAGDPDLGALTSPRQQPIDFAVWQAADGTWQLWSCVRNTKATGKTRLFHRWEGKHLTDPNWRPMDVALQAEPRLGETPGGLQAPHVVRYLMFYGDWENICLATSADGKRFERVVNAAGKTALFGEGPGANTRDPMVLRIDGRWHCYYTAHAEKQGVVFCRTSPDLVRWGESTAVAFGGRAGTGPYAAECPHVVRAGGHYYLFRTQRYGADARTAVYRSDDPLRFGINQDRLHYVTTLPLAAPEVIRHEGKEYLAALRPDLKGIRIARLAWVRP
jgi:hypothetical protein